MSATRPAPPTLSDLQLPVELTRRQPLRRRKMWLLLIISGTLLAGAEAIWLSRNYWLQQPFVRMALTPLLARTGHELQRPLLPQAWQVAGLTLRSEPLDAAAWHVDALLSHQADILQPWPTLNLRLRDWQGQTIATRRLEPADYLPADLPPHLGPQALIASEQPVRISVAVAIPARADGGLPAFEQAELSPQP